MIEVKNNSESTDIYVTGDILDDSWKGWSWGEDFNTYPTNIKTLLDDSKNKPVNVHINSGGGDLFAGVAISNMLKNHACKTTAIVDGLAASAASIIAFGCDEIQVPSNAYIMIHKPSCFCGGNSDDFLKMAETLETLQKGLVETYITKARNGVTAEKINEMINNETWLTGNDATEFFNINLTEKSQIDNNFGCILNYANTPGELKNLKNEDLSSKIKEIELELEG